MTRIESPLFRVLLQRRLSLPLPLSQRICGCGLPNDTFGHMFADRVAGKEGCSPRERCSQDLQRSRRTCGDHHVREEHGLGSLKAQAIFVQAGCDAESRSFQESALLHLCKSDISMVRRGWSHVEVPNGWVQLIREPRPKSVQWPRASKEGKLQQQVRQQVRPSRAVIGSSRNLEEVVEQARKRVGQLQIAIQALDPTDPARPVLEDALKKVKGHATLPSLEEQIQSTEQFVVRAKKRLDNTEKEVVAITEKRDGLRAELVSSEERLARLRQDVSLAGDDHSVPQLHIPAEVVSELERLRSMVANFAQDRDLDMKRLREQVVQKQGDSTLVERPRVRQRLDLVPHMPALIPAELAQWMEDRQADLQEALSLDDTNRILELTSKFSEGAERLVEMRGGMSP